MTNNNRVDLAHVRSAAEISHAQVGISRGFVQWRNSNGKSHKKATACDRHDPTIRTTNTWIVPVRGLHHRTGRTRIAATFGFA